MLLSVNLRHAPYRRKGIGACYLTIDLRYQRGGAVQRHKHKKWKGNKKQTESKGAKNGLARCVFSLRVFGPRQPGKARRMKIRAIPALHFIHRVDAVR